MTRTAILGNLYSQVPELEEYLLSVVREDGTPHFRGGQHAWLTQDMYTADSLVSFCTEVNRKYLKYGPRIVKGAVPLDRNHPVQRYVGDDHIELTSTPVSFLGELTVAEEVLGISISEKDTFISEQYGNFSESYMLKPHNHSELLLSTKVIGGRNLPFLDIPKLRVLLPVVTMGQKHSDSIEGKVKLQTQTRAWSTGLTRTLNDLASCIQFVTLDLMGSKKFPYLPDFLGGHGIAPLGSDMVQEFWRLTSMYKGGVHQPMIDTITESVGTIASGETTEEEKKLSRSFLGKVFEIKNHWQTWYTHFSKYIPRVSGELDAGHENYLVHETGKDPLVDSVVTRLINSGDLVTEVQAVVHQRTADLTKILLSSTNSQELLEQLDAERKNHRQILLLGKGFRDLHHTLIEALVPDKGTRFGVEETLLSAYYGSTQLRRSFHSQRVYDKSILTEIHEHGPLKVPFDLYNRSGQKINFRLGKSFTEEQRRHLDELRQWLEHREGFPPQYMLDDDPIILQKAIADLQEDLRESRYPVFGVRTSDIRLCRQISEITGYPVVACAPTLGEEEFLHQVTKALEPFPMPEEIIRVHLYTDTGSEEAFRLLSMKDARLNLAKLYLSERPPRIISEGGIGRRLLPSATRKDLQMNIHEPLDMKSSGHRRLTTRLVVKPLHVLFDKGRILSQLWRPNRTRPGRLLRDQKKSPE